MDSRDGGLGQNGRPLRRFWDALLLLLPDQPRLGLCADEHTLRDTDDAPAGDNHGVSLRELLLDDNDDLDHSKSLHARLHLALVNRLERLVTRRKPVPPLLFVYLPGVRRS